MPIRIMHVVDHLGKGGLENGLVNLVTNLDPARFEHVVYAIRQLGPNAERLEKVGARVICQGKRSSDSPVQVGTLAREIRKLQPDIVHSRNWSAIESVLAGRWTGCATVHSEHGFDVDANSREPWRRVCFRRVAFEMANRVLSVSRQLRDSHARRTGFKPERITVIHNGVDRRLFHPDLAERARMREELGLAEDEFCIGCVGNLFPVKDHTTLLAALQELDGKCGKWRVLLAGEGSERARLEAIVAARHWSDRVIFLGTSHRVPELLNAMDVYVLPSVAEGLSNSLLEAMASGLPVIATAVGGNPEVVDDGKSGLLFPVGDSARLAEMLLRLMSQPEVRLEMAQRALRRAREEFSIESMVEKYASLYQSLRPALAPVKAVAGA
jgi:sugar transferase (PEP-CTERM/EpsH1 system associated)